MPTFKAPQYTKTINPKTGLQEPVYTFFIDLNSDDETINFIAETLDEITLLNLQKTILDNLDWWNNFISNFLKSTTKFFTKPYTVEQINKITKHTLNNTISNEFPASVILIPKTIQIMGGNFIINWGYILEPVIINIPVFEESENNAVQMNNLPVSNNQIVDGLEELDINEMPSGDDSTDPFQLDSPAKFFEKQKVKEARLKAKLAVYKAQRQMAQYYEKYGDGISDSESDLDTSDDDSEQEEVQL
jgi:hypothetical protein